MKGKIILYGFLIIVTLLLLSCGQSEKLTTTLFDKIPVSDSHIDFINQLSFDQKFNIYTYRNFYNGGGVGIGDINNDGWMDIYFTSNMNENKLFLNMGENAKGAKGFEFKDISKSSGTTGGRAWSTGVSMVDINGDNWIDIYVCSSGDVDGDNRQNELFINQGDNTFVEEADKYGLADKGLSTHAAFFDFDRDGDLDCYLLNNSFQAIGSFNLKKNERPVRSEIGGDKLFRNDNGFFVDVSEEAGIYGSIIGFGLGVTVGDINLDGWQDIFVSNDFFERDYVYMNNGDGTFTENLESQMKSISGASMGADMADINNDGYPEIFVTEMLPEPNDRLKTKTTFENWDRYQYNLDNDYYHQFTRNMFHLNNGDGTFSEVGRLLGVEATDWSWGALINDFDNDGLKDLFIANGIYKDLTDQDYINYISTEEFAKEVISKDGVDFKALTDVIPSQPIPNYMYRNLGNLHFENVSKKWGLDEPTHSNGAAYADLDNDGDLDLVINNVNSSADIYRNNSEQLEPRNNYLTIKITGSGKNSQALGTRIITHIGNQKLTYQHMPTRGFESSVDPRAHFGIGSNNKIDSLSIYWMEGSYSKIYNIEPNQTITIDYNTIEKNVNKTDLALRNGLFTDVTELSNVSFEHKENAFVDFDRDRLMPHMLSIEGPSLCSGDFNKDGLLDFYVGGAKDQPGSIFLQKGQSTFQKTSQPIFINDKISEDVDCACFDADGDGDTDIYVASGGNEFPRSSSALIDRLYINNGRGSFSKSDQILPSFQFENSSCVIPSDIDSDGDLDLFVGVRAKPFLIGVPADGYVLMNDGSGKFTDVTKARAPQLKNIGMITDGSWSDIDQDGDKDLIVVGEWMGIKVFENENGQLHDISSRMNLDSTDGWWNVIEPVDIDNDGDVDFVLGNHGLNSRFRASRKEPIDQYVNDFDKNGSAEVIITTYSNGIAYPIPLRHDLIMQLPGLKKKYVGYDSYKNATIKDIFTEEQLSNARHTMAYYMESSLLMNHGSEGFELKALPVEAQISPVYAIAIDDFDKDGFIDVVLGGNFYGAKPEAGRYDGSYGTFLKGNGMGDLSYIPNDKTGLYIEDQIRGLAIIPGKQKKYLIVARNNTTMKVFSF